MSQNGASPVNGAPKKQEASESYSYSYSSSSSSKTTAVNGKPETVTELSSSTSISGEPFMPEQLGTLRLTSDEDFRRHFEELKAKAGFTSVNSNESSLLGQPIQAEVSRTQSSSTSTTGYSSGGSLKQQHTQTYDTTLKLREGSFQAGLMSGEQGLHGTVPGASRKNEIGPRGTTSTDEMDGHFRTELDIPVRRYHDTFDEFFRSRLDEFDNSAMEAEMRSRRSDWDRRLEDLKRECFHFSPSTEATTHMGSIDPSKTVSAWPPVRLGNGKTRKTLSKFAKNASTTTTRTYSTTGKHNLTQKIGLPPATITAGPKGNPEFSIQFDCKEFKPEEIKVSTKDGKLLITAHHEEKSGNTTSRKEFKRTIDLPKDIQVSLMRSVLSKDGILNITAPIQPPNYQPAISSSHITQQHATALSSAPSSQVVSVGPSSHDSLNYSMSIAGYLPQEVSVTVEGRKVKVHAKHDEIARGKKTHNEMTKTFDLPSTVDPKQVRSFINNDTLYIEAHLRDDLVGKIHVVPVSHRF